MVISALRPPNELLDRGYLPQHFDWSNFTSIWKTGFGENLGASLKIAGGSTVLVLLVAMPAAYYTARRRFRGRTLFLLLVLATQMFQPAAMLVGIQREFISFNLPSPILSLILVNAGFNLAFAVWILNAYFSSIPVELEEAAMVDGTSRLGALARITLPLALARHRHRADLHVHRRVERVARRADAHAGLAAVAAPAHRRDQQLHRPVLDRLGPPVRRIGDRDASR